MAKIRAKEVNKYLVIFISVIIVSCTNELEFCNEHNEREIMWTNDSYKSSPEKELIPLSELDGIIQYHGSDSWGWFNHTIRVIKQNESRVIQLYDNRRNLKSNTTERIYQESRLTESQFKSLKNKIAKLMCKPVNLETRVGIDGDFYELVIRKNNKLQCFKWQSLLRTKNSEENKALKKEVTELVGELMKLSHFPNGSKQVFLDPTRNTTDSIDVEVYLVNQYNLRKFVAYYKGKELKQNRDGIAEMRIHKRDTLGIKKRIKIKVELLNGEIIEM